MGSHLGLYDGVPVAGDWPAPTLTEALAALGFCTRATSVTGVREVIDMAGRVVTRGRAHEVWRWLADGRPE